MWNWLLPKPEILGSRALTGIVDAGIVVLAIFVAATLFLGPEADDGQERPMAPLIQPGRSLSLPDVDWTEAPRHAVLLVSPTCPTCVQSAPLFAELSDFIRTSPGVRLVVLAAEPIEDVRAWLESVEIDAPDVLRAEDLLSLGFFSVPTLLVVDQEGLVTDLLVGKLEPTQLEHAKVRLVSPATVGALNNGIAAREISEQKLGTFLDQAPFMILDVRERELFAEQHRPGAVNIPNDELYVRAPLELSSALPIVIDCTELDARKCRNAGLRLTQLGLTDVYVLMPGWNPR